MNRAAGPADPPRIAVVGGGIIGVFTAWALLRDGARVVMIDPGIRDRRCSYGNAGSISAGSVAPLGMPGVLARVPGWLLDRRAPLHVRPGYWLPAMPWLLRFVLASSPSRVQAVSHALKALLATSVELYGKRLGELGCLDLLRRTGQLQLYPDHEALRKDQAVWQLRRDRGVVVEEVSADDIRQLEPAIGPRYSCGVFLPDEAMIVDPARLVDSVAEHVARHGGEIVAANALGFDMEGGVPRGLVTDAGRIAADRIVVAAGAWSNRLARQLGDGVPLQTQRGYHVHLGDTGIELRRPVVAADRKYFVTPMETGLRIAGTVEFASLDSPPDDDRAEALLAAVPELLPRMRIGHGTRWMGHRPCLPDSLPVIDRSRHFDNVFYAFGNGHLGLTAAPMTAEIAAALVAGRPPPIDASPFRANRFA